MDATFYAFFLQFASEHQILTWCALWLLWPFVLLPGALLSLARTLVFRTYRFVLVLARGWPPAHLDADGDWDLSDKQSGGN